MPLQAMRHRPRGLTLTETVTALLLLGIGVLSIATVYLERTQAAPAVLLHSKASRLAAEMANRIRSENDNTVQFENPVGVHCDPKLSHASPQEQTNNDIACWQDEVADTLPNGTGAIDYDSGQLTAAYVITVSWSAPGAGTASYILRVDLPQSSVHSDAN